MARIPQRKLQPHLTNPTAGQRQAEARRGDVDRIEGIQAKHVRILGQVPIDGAGEVTFPVRFPVRFIEKPLMTSGWDMDGESDAITGNYPTVSIGTIDWEYQDFDDDYGQYWVGALVAVRTTGQTGLRIYANYIFEGKALLNPVGSSKLVT